MKRLIFILFALSLISSCHQDVKLINTYQYAQANRDMTSRPGYAGKQCEIIINKSSLDCSLILETYEDFKFNQIYSFDIEKGSSLKEAVKPDQYFITIVVGNKKYNDFCFETFAPAWKVDLTNYIDHVSKQNHDKIMTRGGRVK